MERHRHRRGWARGAAAAAVVVGSLGLAFASAGSASGNGWSARAVVRDVSGAKVGTVRFEGDEHGTVVKVNLRGLPGPDSFRGIHLHVNGDKLPCDPAAALGPFMNVGGHWNPTGAAHGGHAGDLPSILVRAGHPAEARSVTGPFDPSQLEGRALIVHAGPDNFANIPTRYSAAGVAGPDSTTLANGDAGGRVACGIVARD